MEYFESQNSCFLGPSKSQLYNLTDTKWRSNLKYKFWLDSICYICSRPRLRSVGFSIYMYAKTELRTRTRKICLLYYLDLVFYCNFFSVLRWLLCAFFLIEWMILSNKKNWSKQEKKVPDFLLLDLTQFFGLKSFSCYLPHPIHYKQKQKTSPIIRFGHCM